MMKRANLIILMLAVIALLPASSPVRLGPDCGIHTIHPDDRILSLVAKAGFNWVIQVFSWQEIEPAPGEYFWEYPDWLVSACHYYGLHLGVRLDHPPQWALSQSDEGVPVDIAAYARFVGMVAQRYRGRVDAYIIWNEPNLAQEWGGLPPNPTGYVELLKAAYQAVKEADPEALVVSAGLAPTNHLDQTAMDDRVFLREMYAAGAKPFFDVLGTHPYGFAYPPDDPPGAHDGLNLARLADLRRIMVENGDAHKPVWATELGWTIASPRPDLAWLEVSEEQQAAYLVGAFRKARQEWPWLKLIVVWNASVGLPAGDEKQGYSILNDDYSPRQAFKALTAMPVARWNRLRRSVWKWWLSLTHGPGPVQVTAPDVPVRLGDVATFYPHWARLHCGKPPCHRWEGAFYVRKPGSGPWMLKMEIMQVEEWGNKVFINGHPLKPPVIPLRAKPDYVSVWSVVEMEVPPGVLREGFNTIEVRDSPRPPVYQNGYARFESMQFRYIQLSPPR